jgi:two-component system response regulator PrrA
VRTAVDGRDALDRLAGPRPDVIVLDVAMPRLDGVTLVRRLRGGGDDTPVCILSARDEVEDRVAGLQAGADDYLVKPFALRELVARLHALLRRRAAPASSAMPAAAPLEAGALRLDPARREATLAGEPLDLTRREWELLDAFARHPGIVLSRQQLLELVWGYTFEADTNVVDVFVGYLRRKLEAGGRPRIVHTVRGVGFVLRPA